MTQSIQYESDNFFSQCGDVQSQFVSPLFQPFYFDYYQH